MEQIINVKNISYTYPSSVVPTLDGCSFELNKGEILSILGPNGAGKSTLLNCLFNILTPQKGEILLNNKEIRKISIKEVAKVLAYVQQNQTSTFAYSVLDYVLMGCAPRISLFEKPKNNEIDSAYKALEIMGIAHLANQMITEISGGERQQAAIARAVAQNPQVILFDEPTSHLDYGNQVRTLKLISKLQTKGFSIVMTTHMPDHCIMLKGKVALLNRDGKMCVGKYEELLTEEKLKAIYNTDLKIVYVDEVKRNVCIPQSL